MTYSEWTCFERQQRRYMLRFTEPRSARQADGREDLRWLDACSSLVKVSLRYRVGKAATRRRSPNRQQCRKISCVCGGNSVGTCCGSQNRGPLVRSLDFEVRRTVLEYGYESGLVWPISIVSSTAIEAEQRVAKVGERDAFACLATGVALIRTSRPQGATGDWIDARSLSTIDRRSFERSVTGA